MVTFFSSCIKEKPVSYSGLYLGQQVSGTEPQLFAPGFISTDLNERDASFTKDGNEFYFSIFAGSFGVILVSKQMNGVWQEPEVASFSGHYSDLEPCVSPDGQRLYFASNRPLEGKGDAKDYDIWFVEKTVSGWGTPQNLGEPVNSEKDEFYPSVTKDGTLYLTAQYENSLGGEDIFWVPQIDGVYQKPENPGEAINSARGEFNACISADESILIFGSFGRGDGQGGGDLYISLKDENGNWTTAQNMGPQINSPALDYCPSISPDGKYLFFTSQRADMPAYSETQRNYKDLLSTFRGPKNGRGDIYWVSTAVLDQFKK